MGKSHRVGRLVKKERTFSVIDHLAPKGQMQMNVDMGPILQALKCIKESIDEIKRLPPHVVEVAPVVNVPEIKMPPVNVTLPEMRPHMEIHPSEIVIQKQDGSITNVKPEIIVNFPVKMLCFFVATLPFTMAAMLLLFYFWSTELH